MSLANLLDQKKKKLIIISRDAANDLFYFAEVWGFALVKAQDFPILMFCQLIGDLKPGFLWVDYQLVEEYYPLSMVIGDEITILIFS